MPADALCNDGQYCNGEETCNDPFGCIAGDVPCLHPWFMCVEDADECIECIDVDGDGTPDACGPDVDGDGVPNADDPCDNTPPLARHNGRGGPLGDIDDDCKVTLNDHEFFVICLQISGPNTIPLFFDCVATFDFDGDADVDMKDASAFFSAVE